MLAKNMMALGKLLTAVLFVSNVHAQSWDKPIYQQELSNETLNGLVYNSYRTLFNRLNKEDSTKHQQAVFLALNRLDNGEVATWYSNDGYHTGKVQVMYTAITNGELCRRIYSDIVLKSTRRTFEEWACYKTNTNTWNFADK